ncbi:MAG: hypothetical protein SFX73_08065 [Kofleriaceae bacterium]|nr:hypothetical protein [Kofleriaceae bacterium]
MKRVALVTLVTLTAGCDDLERFSGGAPPLATLQVLATGDLERVRVPNATGERLRVALVWGEQWLPEPLCILPPADTTVADAVARGCRNPLAFTPARVAASTPLVVGEITTLELTQLPSADVMVGGVDARVAYGSLVIFDDRDGDASLELSRSVRLPTGPFDGGGGSGGMGPPDPEDDEPPSRDIVYGASFVAMTEADRRVAFREGDFTQAGFYPRRNCGAPPAGFSILSAGGFTFEDAVAATLAGELPEQDPASCAEDAIDDTLVEIPLRPSPEVREVACEQRRNDSSVRYRDPPNEAPPNFDARKYACTSIPSLLGEDPATAGITQLVVTNTEDETCRGLTHYLLVGCDDGEPVCDRPAWDLRANPPTWWPCEVPQ